MGKSDVIVLSGRESAVDPLSELPGKGARDLIPQAVEVELAEHLSQYQ